MRSATFATAAIVASAGLLLSSCGQAPEPTSASPTEESPTPAVTPQEAPSSVEAPEPVAPAIIIAPAQIMDLDQYAEFSYQSATATGLAPDAQDTANSELARLSQAWVAEAVAENDTKECRDGEDRCGYFELRLSWVPCDGDLLCVKQDIGKAGIGMATGESLTRAVRLDPASGHDVTLDEFLGQEALDGFLEALNRTTALVQRMNDSFFADSSPNYTAESIPTWLPQEGGITVWYPKYEVGPGAFGIIEARLEPNGDGWNSWVTQQDERMPILQAGATTSPRSKEGVSTASKVTRAEVLNDLGWDLDLTWCRKITLSNRDPDWGVLDESKKAYDNPDSCVLSDSFSYIGKIDGTWRTLDYAGSSVDTCIGLRQGLSEEGVTSNAIEDFISEWGCMSDDEMLALVDPEEFSDAPALAPADPAPAVQLVEVPRVVGLFNKDAEALLIRAGLRVWMQAQIGDPSIAAQGSNQCVVQDQNPPAGSMVERGTQVTARMQCPNTGYNAPAPPQPWSG